MKILFVDLEEEKYEKDYYFTKKNMDRTAKIFFNFLQRLLLLPPDLLNQLNRIYIYVGDREYAIFHLTEAFKFYAPQVCANTRYKSVHHLFRDGNYKVVSNSEDSPDIYLVDEFIFIDVFLTPISFLYLLLMKNVSGYKAIKKRQNYIYEKISDPKKYLNVGLALYSNFENKVESNQFTIKDKLARSLYEPAVSAKLGVRKKFRFKFLYPEEYYNLFVLILTDLFGKMLIVRCDEEGYVLPNKKVNILILNIEKLNETKQSELYYEITSDKYLEQLVIVVDLNPEKLVGYPQISEYEIIPKEITDKLWDKTDYKILKDIRADINRLINNLKYILSQTNVDKNTKEKILNTLENNLIVSENNKLKKRDLEKINFWYNLDLVITVNLLEIYTKSEELVVDHFKKDISNKIIHFKIEHDIDKDNWCIHKNDNFIKKISYSNSKGMKYLAFLSKYYTQKTISDTKLRSAIDNWHGKFKKTAEKSTDAKKILQDLIYFFDKQCPELSPLRECVIISSKEPGCYFEPKNNITVEFVDPFIPQSI